MSCPTTMSVYDKPYKIHVCIVWHCLLSLRNWCVNCDMMHFSHGSVEKIEAVWYLICLDLWCNPNNLVFILCLHKMARFCKPTATQVLSIMVFWGQIQNYMMRANVSILIVAMVKDRDSGSSLNTTLPLTCVQNTNQKS